MILQCISFSISIKCNKFQPPGEITKSGDKNLGPNLIVLIQAKLPVHPGCFAKDQARCSGCAGEQNRRRRSEAQRPPGVFTAEILTERDLQIRSALVSYRP